MDSKNRFTMRRVDRLRGRVTLIGADRNGNTYDLKWSYIVKIDTQKMYGLNKV